MDGIAKYLLIQKNYSRFDLLLVSLLLEEQTKLDSAGYAPLDCFILVCRILDSSIFSIHSRVQKGFSYIQRASIVQPLDRCCRRCGWDSNSSALSCKVSTSFIWLVQIWTQGEVAVWCWFRLPYVPLYQSAITNEPKFVACSSIYSSYHLKCRTIHCCPRPCGNGALCSGSLSLCSNMGGDCLPWFPSPIFNQIHACMECNIS